MSAKTFRVYFNTGASASVSVTVDELDDPNDTRESAIEAAYGVLGGQFLCASCSGWGQPWGVDLGEWEVDDADDAVVEVES